MANNHVITRQIGNLRGFSTDSIFLRPSNVADTAINMQRAPDGTLQLRRGYQCQIAKIGGLGNGTFDDPTTDEVKTVTLSTNGFLYNKLVKQIFFYYDGQVSGEITGVTNPSADLTNIVSVGHGLQTGAQVILRNIQGSTQLNNPSTFGMVKYNFYTITVVDADNFTLNGIPYSSISPYTGGGLWSINFADNRYIVITIFTDPRFLTTNPGWSFAAWSLTPWGSPGGESITCNITVNRAAQVQGVLGVISFVTQAVLAQVTSQNHNLSTGMQITISGVNGMVQLNGNSYLVTVVDVNNFTLNVDSSSFGAYISGGSWKINATNVVPVSFGHELVALDVIQFYSSGGVFNQRNVVSVTPTSITFDGYPVAFTNGTYLNQFFDIPFRKGFDVTTPFMISEFIDIITNPTTGVHGLQVAINGDSNYPAAFLEIFEPMIVDSNSTFQIDYWYWEQINSTLGPNPPFPGSANTRYQNSPEFENASMAAYDDVIYITNGWDYPQKYDGQTVYRAGMPLGVRPPMAADNTTYISQPFVSGNKYQYAITYEQVDNRGHIVEGELSEILPYEVGAANAAIDLTVTNLRSTTGNNWNTNGGIVNLASGTQYGPDVNGFYYELVALFPGYTLKIGDSAYYLDKAAAVFTSAETDAYTFPVNPGHSIEVGDNIYFIDDSDVEISRIVSGVTANSITIRGAPVTTNISDATHTNVKKYQTNLVFGPVAIFDGVQNNTNTLNVLAGHSLGFSDVVEFLDSELNLQRREVTSTTLTSITIDGIPVSVLDKYLMSAIELDGALINLQRRTANAPSMPGNTIISNNLRINIYRTYEGQSFGVDGKLYLVASIPNDSIGTTTQVFIDGIPDVELTRPYDVPLEIPTPPPISKYVKAFGNQLFYAGGERGNPENSDRVFFSNGNEPEVVPLAVNFFNVPNVDDDITGIGVSGSTLVTTKNNSLWATTGNFLSGQIEVVQIAPGTNIGCACHASIASVGTLMYFLHTNGVYAITENQLFPTDAFGNPIPISLAIDVIFRETNFLPQTRYVLKRAVAVNYTKDNQYLLFLPCEDSQSTIRTANANSIILAYDYQEKNWFKWTNMNAAGGMFVIDDYLYFQERRFSGVDGNTANLYKQHRFYRLIDHADHAGPQRIEWKSSWEDLRQPEVRKKFCRCILLMDRLSELLQFNNPVMNFSTYLDRLPNLQSTIAKITQVDNIRNSSWSYSGWGWNYWSGYQDSFITVNLKGGTVAKSIQVGFTIQGINMDIKLAGFQLEAIPENRNTVVR